MGIRQISKNKAQLIVSVGSESKGTRRRVTKVVEYTKKKELEKMYQRFEDEVRRNPLTHSTVDELLEHYISNAEIRGLSANTIHGYKAAQKRINKAFNSVLARELTTYQLDSFIADMAKKYAPKTISNTIALLDASYQRAVRAGQLASNPCEGVTLPKQKKREIKTLPPEQISLFIDALCRERLDIRVGYELCLMCGLRRGEVLGIREGDINLLFRTVSINKARYIVEGKPVLQMPKTERSNRVLALPQTLADDIDRLIKEHHSQQFYHSDFLIQDAFGDPLSPSVFSARVTELEENAGLDRVTAHGLRHTFATLLNSAHVDAAQISAELGHSNLATTMNIYTHVFGDVSASSRSIADTIDGVFREKGAKEAQIEDEKTAESL